MNQNVLKTREKKVVTMDIGAFRAKETVLQSREDRMISTCHDLKSLAPHRCTFGYDVIVYVRYALFVHCRSEFEQIKQQYGDPIALVHDMGKGILSAVETVFPGKPDFICHFHFLRDIGKDLMEDEYKQIRNRLKKHKIRGSLRQMARSLEGRVVQDPGAMEALKAGMKKGGDVASFGQMPAVSAFALIHWAFDASAQLNGYGFPFDLPHLLFYHRLKAVYALVEAIRNTPLRHEKTHRPLHRLFRSIKQVMDDPALRKSAT